MSLLLDTNVCIALINGRHPSVRAKFAASVEAHVPMFFSTITQFELWYGVARTASERRAANQARLESFLTGPFEPLPFDAGAAKRAGALREALRHRPIGPFDLLIAAQALAQSMTLVTNNTGEFARVPGLSIEDWQTAG